MRFSAHAVVARGVPGGRTRDGSVMSVLAWSRKGCTRESAVCPKVRIRPSFVDTLK
jgi:hypothetical protein